MICLDGQKIGYKPSSCKHGSVHLNKRLVMTITFKDVEAVSKKARQDDDLGTEHLQVTRVYEPS